MSTSILVTILDDTKADKCEAHCGLEFTSPQTAEEVSEILKKQFGDVIQLQYLDLTEPEANRLYPEMVDRVRAEQLSLPLLLINGNLRISGYFDIHLLQNVIQAELEMEL